MDTLNKIFDLYGIIAKDLDESRNLVEQVIGSQLQPRESSYRGGDYFGLDDLGTENFILQRNYDDTQGEWTESAHRDAPFLLYVSESPSADKYRSELESRPSIRLLRRDLA